MRDRTCIIDLNTKKYTVLKYKQYDNNVPIVFKIIENSQDVDLTGYTVGAFFYREDGNIYEKNTSISGANVTTTIDNNITGLSGIVKVELVFVYDSKTVTSFSVYLNIEKSIDKEDAVTADPQWDIIKDLLTAGTLVNPIDDNLTATNKTWSSNKISSQIKDKTSNLQGQINNLVLNSNGDSNPEIVQARSNFKGVRFGTLTERNLFVENSLDGNDFSISCTWEEGGINGNTGADTPVSGYLRTVGYLVFTGLDNVEIIIKNCKLYVLKYTNDMNFMESSFMTDSFVISDTNSYYRFVIVPTDSSIQLISSNFITITGSYCFKEIQNIKTEIQNIKSDNSKEAQNIKNEIQDIKFDSLAYDEVFRLSDKYIGGLSYKERLNWEIGGINGSTGENVDIDYAIRSDFFNIENKVEVFSEKDIYAIAYNTDGTYHSRINHDNHIINLTDNTKKYRLVLNFGYDSGITITDPNSMLNYISIKSEEVFTQNVLAIVESSLKGEKINCLGDSITSIDYTRPNWWEMIATETGATFNNYGISGTCIGYNEQRENNNGKCFCNRYMDMDATADAVVVMGGTNDYEIKLGQWNDTTNESFFGALNVLMKGLLETYKGKPIIFMTPIQSSDACETNIIDPLAAIKNGSGSSVSLQLRAEAVKRKCMQYGITCIDLFNNSGINGADSSKIYYRPDDTLHPSAYGQKIIANNLLPVLKNKFKF